MTKKSANLRGMAAILWGGGDHWPNTNRKSAGTAIFESAICGDLLYLVFAIPLNGFTTYKYESSGFYLGRASIWRKNSKFCAIKIFRQIYALVISLIKTLVSWNLCQKSVRIYFCTLYIQCFKSSRANFCKAILL